MGSVALKINDFGLFYETVSNITKISKSAKITFGRSGFKTSVKTDGRVARLDVSSNAVCIDGDDIAICTQELNVLSQILYKIVKAHAPKSRKSEPPDYSDVSISIEDETSVRIKSNTFKTSFGLVKESAITVLKSHNYAWNTIAEVNVELDDIKEVLSSTFVFRDTKDLLVSICHQDDMVRNVAYAEIYDPKDPTANKFVTKFGNIMVGDLTRRILFDIPRFQVMSVFPVDAMVVKLNQQPCAFTNFSISGDEKSGCKTDFTLLFEYMSDSYAVANNGTAA